MTRPLAFALLGLLASPTALAQTAARSAPAQTPDLRLGTARAAAADDPAWSWSPEPRWLVGVRFGLGSFDGGLGYGYRFIGSSLGPAEVFPVDIVFDPSVVTKARVFRRDLGFADAGVGTFRGAAYDVRDPSAPRRLNVALVEDARLKAADATWNPDDSGDGAREYLLVLASSYDGDGSTNAGALAYDLDTVIGLAARVPSGSTLYQTAPATLSLDVPALGSVTATATANGALDVRWVAATFAGGTVVRVVGDGGAPLAEAEAGTGTARIDGLDETVTYALRVELLDGSGAVLSSVPVSVRPVVRVGVEAAASLDPGRTGGSTYGDLWGYTAPDGTEYALLAGRGAGLSVIDITAAPAGAPVEVGFVPTAPGASDSKDVKVYGHHAYLVNERGPIQIVDLSDPAAPAQVGTLDTQPGVGDGGAHNVAVFDGHLWVTGGRTAGNAGVRVYDVRTTPQAPVLVGEFQPTHFTTPYYHDFEVKGAYGFGPGIYGDGVDILDVRDPANITRVSTFNYPGGSGAHNTCASADGGTLYVGDEIGAAGNWTRIFDISDPDNVELVGEIVVDRDAAVHNCYVDGDRLYIAHYTEGLRVYDVADPQAPVEVALYDTYLQPGYGYNGAWSVYPYFASGKVVVSDMQSGLFVVTPSAAAVAQEGGPEAEAAALSLAPNPVRGRARVAFRLDAPARVRLSVFDVQGREVARLLDDAREAEGDADLDASALSPGVYVVRLTADGRVRASRPITVVR